MDFTLWSIFAVAYLGLTLSPGPNVFIVLTHAAKYGFRSIAVTILGNLTCQLLIVTSVGLGIGALLTTQSIAYHMLKYAGAAYLIYLGTRIVYDLFMRKNQAKLEAPVGIEKERNIPSIPRRYFAAVAVSASNPKTVIFLSAFLPQFVSADRPIFLQFAIMYLTIAAIVITIHSLYAYTVVKLKNRIPRAMTGRVFPGLSAAIYIFLGASLGASK